MRARRGRWQRHGPAGPLCKKNCSMLKGSCHCGATHWTFEGDPGSVTTCNCTLCRRYGVLWAYGYVDERIRIAGPVTRYSPQAPAFRLG